MRTSDTLDAVVILQNVLTDRATGGEPDPQVYAELRRELMEDSSVRALLPSFVKRSLNLNHFWNFIQPKFDTYAQRRKYLQESFEPLLKLLEAGVTSPADELVSETLSILNAEHVEEIWRRALQPRSSDPEGAVTLATTLLESVCKLILDETGITYDRADLPKAYHLVVHQLNLAPSQYSEKLFRTILGNCQAVVGGLAATRNAHGDAHGKGKTGYQLAPRHAELAVNLAGAVAMFIVRTWEEREVE